MVSAELKSTLDLLFTLLNTLVGCFGLVFVVVSLFFVFRQTRDLNRQTELATQASRVSAYNEVARQMMEIDRFFVENPQYKPYFYEGKAASKDQADYPAIASIAEWLADFMDSVFMLARTLPEYPWDTTWYVYFCDLLKASPALHDYWKEHINWYPGSIQAYYPPKVAATIREITLS